MTHAYRKRSAKNTTNFFYVLGLIIIVVIFGLFIFRDEKVEQPFLVEIAVTPTGFLNVREDSNGGAEIVYKVKLGETYLVIDKDGGWYLIEADGKMLGWVAKRYTKKADDKY